ncbi:hypothetical protein [Pedobacter aquatilis]|uniref:hypothetical protein n=1 Tax=Pedobacter aquatilis TaxID=351343 RepID=UPI00292D7CDB|nr:hypothetical protein [Pedobacter aquatilis]
MKKIVNNIWVYFSEINYGSLWNSFLEVLWMTLIAFCPLLINIAIAALASNDLNGAFNKKIIPGEILSYCMSFLAPSLYLLVKTHGTNYRLPFLKFFSLLTVLIYVATVTLYLVAKNKWVKEIDMDQHDFDLYFQLSLIFLVTSILFRIYSIYHGGFSNWTSTRRQQQEDFNRTFTAGLNNNR